MISSLVVADPAQLLPNVATRMGALGLGVNAVIDRFDHRHPDGLIIKFAFLDGRQKLLDQELHAERVVALRRVTARRSEDIAATDGSSDSTDVA